MIYNIDMFGTKRYTNEKGSLHREDGPAFITTSGNKAYYINGNHPKDNSICIVGANGDIIRGNYLRSTLENIFATRFPVVVKDCANGYKLGGHHKLP